MRWEIRKFHDGSSSWLQADTPVGEWAIEECGETFAAYWLPSWATSDEVKIGTYRTQGAAKGAIKRYAKRMAAAFKAMSKAGWQ